MYLPRLELDEELAWELGEHAVSWLEVEDVGGRQVEDDDYSPGVRLQATVGAQGLGQGTAGMEQGSTVRTVGGRGGGRR